MSEIASVNLKQLFGGRYRVGLEAAGRTAALWPEDDLAWLEEILCRHGVIHPQGGTLLVAVTDRPGVARKLKRLSCVVQTRGDVTREDGVTVGELRAVFDVADAPEVFRVMRPRRRRQVSARERARLSEILARARQRKAAKALSESEETGLAARPATLGRPEPLAAASARVSAARGRR